MKVNYNVSAMIANNALQRNDTLLSASLERLSSGLKIANAKDNPSGLAMAKRMNSQIEGLDTANNSANDAISIVQVADGSLSEIHEILQRMSELAIKASNDTMTQDDRLAVQEEIDQLKEEIERMAKNTQFNGQSILDGSFDLRGYATVEDATGERKTDPNIDIESYSDMMEAGKYDITGINVTYSEYDGLTGVTRKTLVVNSTNIEVRKVGSTDSYMNKPLTVETQDDLLIISDNSGKEIKVKIQQQLDKTTTPPQTSKTFAGDIEAELLGTGAMTMQVGANEGQTVDIRIPKISLTSLGISNLDVSLVGDANGEYVDGPREAIESIKQAINQVSKIRSGLGAYQNRLEHAVSNLDVSVENMTAAYSRIMDVDMAEEMTTYSTQQVLSQAGISMMAQANERPSQVLQLLQ